MRSPPEAKGPSLDLGPERSSEMTTTMLPTRLKELIAELLPPHLNSLAGMHPYNHLETEDGIEIGVIYESQVDGPRHTCVVQCENHAFCVSTVITVVEIEDISDEWFES
jgi:hypothetical protein